MTTDNSRAEFEGEVTNNNLEKFLEFIGFDNECCACPNGSYKIEKNFYVAASRAAPDAVIDKLVEAARGLSGGVDWNNGTHAKIYRQKLLEALAAAEVYRKGADHAKADESVEALESPHNDSYVTRQSVIALIRKHETEIEKALLAEWKEQLNYRSSESDEIASLFRPGSEENLIWNKAIHTCWRIVQEQSRKHEARLDDPALVEVVAESICEQMGQDENEYEDIAQAAIAAVKRYLGEKP